MTGIYESLADFRQAISAECLPRETCLFLDLLKKNMPDGLLVTIAPQTDMRMTRGLRYVSMPGGEEYIGAYIVI